MGQMYMEGEKYLLEQFPLGIYHSEAVYVRCLEGCVEKGGEREGEGGEGEGEEGCYGMCMELGGVEGGCEEGLCI